MLMVTSEGGDADGEQAGTMYVKHTARNSESFPSLVLDSRSQLGCLLFPSRPLTLGQPCALAFALAPPPCTRITSDLPLAVHQTLTIGVVGTFVLAATPSLLSPHFHLLLLTVHFACTAPTSVCPPRLPSQSPVPSPESVQCINLAIQHFCLRCQTQAASHLALLH
ncbi:hypothetical protein B0H13DRAFT_2351586 [Mycena leptocephala]|nr:hypothetical protein B0H13DRAFT_2351586 [Mycena leptocephala]